MSANESLSTQQWFWTDDLARVLVDDGHHLSPPPSWLATPFAVRRRGEPLVVAFELLTSREGSDAAA